MTARGWIVGAAVALAVTVGACSSEGGGDVTADAGGSATSADLEEDSLLEARVDPDDPTHVVLIYGACWADPVPEVVEGDATVTVAVDGVILEKPCNPVPVSVDLRAPLGDRAVVDAEDGRHVPVLELAPIDPSTLVAAECTEQAADDAVELDVDGGLRAQLVACDGSWMAVDTSTNACAATGEAPEPGCIGNHHVAIFRNVEGHWQVAGFDDCEALRRQHEVPDEICRAVAAAMG